MVWEVWNKHRIPKMIWSDIFKIFQRFKIKPENSESSEIRKYNNIVSNYRERGEPNLMSSITTFFTTNKP